MAVSKKIIATGVATAALVGLAFAGTTLAGHGLGGFEGRGQNQTPLTAEQREARETEMKTKREETLTKAVTDGKLTTEQKAHMDAAHEQIHEKMEAGDRDGAMKLRNELRAWEDAQKIDRSVMPGRGNGGMGQGLRDGSGAHRFGNK